MAQDKGAVLFICIICITLHAYIAVILHLNIVNFILTVDHVASIVILWEK